MKLKKLMLGFMTTTLSLSSILAHVGDDYYGHHGMMGQWYGGMWGWGFNSILISVILVLLIILLIIIIQKQLNKK